jgi:hypothetical protein
VSSSVQDIFLYSPVLCSIFYFIFLDVILFRVEITLCNYNKYNRNPLKLILYIIHGNLKKGILFLLTTIIFFVSSFPVMCWLLVAAKGFECKTCKQHFRGIPCAKTACMSHVTPSQKPKTRDGDVGTPLSTLQNTTQVR